MTSAAGEQSLPPPLNSAIAGNGSADPAPPAPAVTPPEPARDDLVIASVIAAAITAVVAAGLLWRAWRRGRVGRR